MKGQRKKEEFVPNQVHAKANIDLTLLLVLNSLAEDKHTKMWQPTEMPLEILQESVPSTRQWSTMPPLQKSARKRTASTTAMAPIIKTQQTPATSVGSREVSSSPRTKLRWITPTSSWLTPVRNVLWKSKTGPLHYWLSRIGAGLTDVWETGTSMHSTTVILEWHARQA